MSGSMPGFHLSRLKWLAACARFEAAALRYTAYRRKANFDPGQPRDELGQWAPVSSGAETAGENGLSIRLTQVIRVCTLGGVARSTDNRSGNKSFTATYDCFGGYTITRKGSGHFVPGLIRDPRF